MLDETGCDALMIGRASLGNPWIFKEIIEYIENGRIIDKPTNIDKINMCIKHLNYLKEIKVEKIAVLEIRNHIAWYLKGIKGSNEIKNKIYLTKDIEMIENILEKYKEKILEENL